MVECMVAGGKMVVVTLLHVEKQALLHVAMMHMMLVSMQAQDRSLKRAVLHLHPLNHRRLINPHPKHLHPVRPSQKVAMDLTRVQIKKLNLKQNINSFFNNLH